jgi:hypothetical protein
MKRAIGIQEVARELVQDLANLGHILKRAALPLQLVQPSFQAGQDRVSRGRSSLASRPRGSFLIAKQEVQIAQELRVTGSGGEIEVSEYLLLGTAESLIGLGSVAAHGFPFSQSQAQVSGAFILCQGVTDGPAGLESLRAAMGAWIAADLAGRLSVFLGGGRNAIAA